MKHHDLVEVEGILIHETSPDDENAGAFLIRTEDKKETWIQKSKCTKTKHPRKRNWYTFEMPEQYAIDKELI